MVAEIEVLPLPGPGIRAAPWAGLAILAMAAVGGIWRWYGRRSWLPEPKPAPTKPGLAFVLPALPALPGTPEEPAKTPIKMRRPAVKRGVILRLIDRIRKL